MQTEQAICTSSTGELPPGLGRLVEAQLVLLFGCPDLLRNADLLAKIRACYPRACFIGCSTAGEISGTRVYDDTLVVTAIQFARATVRGASMRIEAATESRAAGQALARSLDPDGLRHVFVLSDGIHVNGSELVRGLNEALPHGVSATGGLSADGARFRSTLVLWDHAAVPGAIAAVGLYGKELRIGYGSLGGWDPFGPDRLITRSRGNVLYEVDGRPALDLYKKYLGDFARDLPASGLLFPMLVREDERSRGVVRTILSVDEKEGTMTFAGDMPQGAYARLMKANFDRLIDGATGAARVNVDALGTTFPGLAILISCVGRKLVLKQRTEEEVEAVREVLGPNTAIAGYYSYGEISPLVPGASCELHNQTMTITTIAEAEETMTP
jgi:hypothetical protein